MKTTFTLLLYASLLLMHLPSHAQRFYEHNGESWYGGGLVANQYSISSIYEMLVDESIFLLTPHEERSVNAIGGSFWIRYGAPYSDFFIEGQFSLLSVYKPQGQFEKFEGGHFYLQNDRGLEYSILFDYDQVSFGVFPGYFLPLPNREKTDFGIYLTAGLNWSILSGTSIDYASNEPQFDLAVEESLEMGLKYRNNLTFLPGIGIQQKFNNNLALELRYSQGWGLVDIIETQENSYFWRERLNKTRVAHQVALTFLVLFDR